jgi:hypothetical protein
MSDWFEYELRIGLASLATLMLDGAPAYDMTVITAREWAAALTFERSWSEERDTQRIREAFLRLGRDSLHWPTPRAFLVALLPTKQQRLPRSTGPREPTPHALKCVAEIKAMFEDVDGWAIRPTPFYAALRHSFPRRLGPIHYHDARAAAAGAHLDDDKPDPLDPANWPEDQSEEVAQEDVADREIE